MCFVYCELSWLIVKGSPQVRNQSCIACGPNELPLLRRLKTVMCAGLSPRIKDCLLLLLNFEAINLLQIASKLIAMTRVKMRVDFLFVESANIFALFVASRSLNIFVKKKGKEWDLLERGWVAVDSIGDSRMKVLEEMCKTTCSRSINQSGLD